MGEASGSSRLELQCGKGIHRHREHSEGNRNQEPGAKLDRSGTSQATNITIHTDLAIYTELYLMSNSETISMSYQIEEVYKCG